MTSIPPNCKNLTKIKELYLDSNNIWVLRPQIKYLKELLILDISEKNFSFQNTQPFKVPQELSEI